MEDNQKQYVADVIDSQHKLVAVTPDISLALYWARLRFSPTTGRGWAYGYRLRTLEEK